MYDIGCFLCGPAKRKNEFHISYWLGLSGNEVKQREWDEGVGTGSIIMVFVDLGLSCCVSEIRVWAQGAYGLC